MVGGTFMSGPHIMALMIVIYGVALLSRRVSRQSSPFPVSPSLYPCTSIGLPGGLSLLSSPRGVPASGVCVSGLAGRLPSLHLLKEIE
jgi:hypothetical protein